MGLLPCLASRRAGRASLFACALAAAALLNTSSPAVAAEGEAPRVEDHPAPTPMRRVWGIGSGMTLGWEAGRTSSLKLERLEYGLIDFDLFINLTPRVDLQLWLPLSFTAWANFAVSRLYVEAAAIARVRPFLGSGFYVGPGLDVHAFKARSFEDTNYAVTVPIAIGYETGVAEQKTFSYSIALRPAFGALFDRNGFNNTTLVGFAWSLLVEMEFTGWIREPARR